MTTSSLPIGDPEALGFDSERLSRIGPAMQKFIDDGKVPNLVTLAARKGQIVHLDARGVMDLDSRQPVDASTLFRLYSNTKPIAGVAALILYEAGLLTPDDPVSKFLPEYGSLRVAVAEGPAMTREEAVLALEVGIELVDEAMAEGASMFATGEMGIGNTTASSAVIAVLTGRSPAEVTGRGTGISKDALPHKVAVIERALAINQPEPGDALDVLAKVGGLEIAAMAGVMLGAAAHRAPAVMDGFISAAAALVAVRLCPAVGDYIVPSHVSIEVGHQVVLEEMGLTPLFDLQMRLGEGTGAALSMSILDAAAKTLAEMATFESAGLAGDPNEADAELERGG